MDQERGGYTIHEQRKLESSLSVAEYALEQAQEETEELLQENKALRHEKDEINASLQDLQVTYSQLRAREEGKNKTLALVKAENARLRELLSTSEENEASLVEELTVEREAGEAHLLLGRRRDDELEKGRKAQEKLLKELDGRRRREQELLERIQGLEEENERLSTMRKSEERKFQALKREDDLRLSGLEQEMNELRRVSQEQEDTERGLIQELRLRLEEAKARERDLVRKVHALKVREAEHEQQSQSIEASLLLLAQSGEEEKGEEEEGDLMSWPLSPLLKQEESRKKRKKKGGRKAVGQQEGSRVSVHGLERKLGDVQDEDEDLVHLWQAIIEETSPAKKKRSRKIKRAKMRPERETNSQSKPWR